MLKDMYPYCDKGSTAKVKVLYGDISADYTTVEADESYTLQNADYDAMGEESGQPGKYNNFDSSMDLDAYLTAFCAEKYATLEVGKIVCIGYKFYAGSTSDKEAFYQKTAEGWQSYSSFTPDKTYELVTEDYDSMGEDRGFPGKYDNFDSNMDVDFYLTTFLKNHFPYAADGLTCEVTYKYYANKITENRKAVYKNNAGVWMSYNPFAEVTTVTSKIAELSYDGTAWTLLRLLGGSKEITFAEADYQALVDWVAANKPEGFLGQDPTKEEYYFGASSKYGNVNNKYSTWVKYYNVDGYLTGKSDEEIQNIMDEHLAFGIAEILLPQWIDKPDSGLSYVVIYKVYGGRGDGYYAMSFMYNEGTGKYEKTSDPVKK